MTLGDLLQYCKQKTEIYPYLSDEISGFYDLAQSEIENGESEEHEVELAMIDIDNLIQEQAHGYR